MKYFMVEGRSTLTSMNEDLSHIHGSQIFYHIWSIQIIPHMVQIKEVTEYHYVYVATSEMTLIYRSYNHSLLRFNNFIHI